LAVLLIWVALALLVLARIAALASPGMEFWSQNTGRFLPPAISWPLEIALLASLLPPVARQVVAWLDAIGNSLVGRDRRPALLLIVLAMWVVWLLPDQTHFTGDFLLKESSASQPGDPSSLFPQALPLDLALHNRLPRYLADRGILPIALESRILGCIEAGILMALALRFIRVLKISGATAASIIAVTVFGGYFSLFCGYNKSVTELVLCGVAIGTWGISVLAAADDPFPLGVAAGLAIAMHRSGVALVPAALFPALTILFRKEDRRRNDALLAVAIPVVILGLTLPASLQAWTTLDVHRLLRWPAMGHQGPAAGPIVDALNALGLLVPTGVIIVPMVLARSSSTTRALNILLAAQLLPLLLGLVFLAPPQGMFRDWDMFAGMAAMAAVGLASRLSGEGALPKKWRWLTVAIALAALVPTIELMIVQSDVSRGLARVEAFATQKPAKSEDVLGRTWGFLAMRYWQIGNMERAAGSADSAAARAPSKMILTLLAAADEASGRFDKARSDYRRALERDSLDWRNWIGLAEVSLQVGDTSEATAALQAALKIHPNAQAALELLRQVHSESAGRVAPRTGP
jgi:Flp pilus assembly protein TadD